MAILLFVDPFIFLRVIFGNDVIVLIILLFICLFIFLNALKKKLGNTTFSVNVTKWFSLYVVLYFITRFSAGIDFGNYINSIRFILSVFVIIKFLSVKNGSDILIKAYVFAGIIHVLGVLPIGFIQERLSEYTAYKTEVYSIGFLNKRGTGFFPSPGFLILYASGLTMIGWSKIINDKYGWFIMFLGIFLAFATLNRSFLVVIAFILILFILNFHRKEVSKLALWIIPFFFFLLHVDKVISFFDLYYVYLVERFNADSLLESDRLIGVSGIWQSLQVISNYPIFGNAVSIDGGALEAWNGNMIVNPHMGLLKLLTNYGVIFGGIYLLLILKALFLSTISFLKRNNLKYSLFHKGFIAVNFMCLFEPLCESTVFLFFLLGVFFIENDKRKVHLI